MDQIVAIASLIAAPVITAIVTWVWKLDARIFTLYSIVLTREEFAKAMHDLRAEIKEARDHDRNRVRRHVGDTE